MFFLEKRNSKISKQLSVLSQKLCLKNTCVIQINYVVLGDLNVNTVGNTMLILLLLLHVHAAFATIPLCICF